MTDHETLEGHVVDLICVRKYPRHELAQRARRHTRECALHGHCVESGYALVDQNGGLALLDPAATPLVVQALRGSSREAGIALRAERQRDGEEMRTTRVGERSDG